MQQRHLMFLDIPFPHEAVWTQLSDEQRRAVVDVLVRLMTQTAIPQTQTQENSDD